MKKIILASKSPRRHDILNLAGYSHTVMVSDADETLPAGISPADAVRVLSVRKAEAVLSELNNEGSEDFVIIAADTVVEFEGDIFGKPKDEADARRMLSAMSGKSHYVHTGVTVTDGERTVSETVSARVVMREITSEELEGYIASGAPMDKAGAYGIQGTAGAFVSSVEGDFFSIMGLPMCRLSEILREYGIGLFEE